MNHRTGREAPLHHQATSSQIFTMTTADQLPHDLVAPSITLLWCSTTYTGLKLNKLTVNYKTWLKSADLFLTLTGLSGYAKGTVDRPNSSQPHAPANWEANDALAAALISSTIEPTE